MIYKLLIKILLLFVISSCSTMGKVAKNTFIYGTEFYRAQPKIVTDNYPEHFNKTFYTGALFITDYNVWRIRIVSESDMTEFIDENQILVDLEYEFEFQDYRKTVPLIFESYELIETDDAELHAFDFAFSPEGRPFWLTFHNLMFEMKRPWFHYPMSPQLPLEMKRTVTSVEYNFVPDWGFLTLREFMDMFELNTDKKWDEFCFWNNYSYDDTSVCGEIQIEDDPDSRQESTTHADI